MNDAHKHWRKMMGWLWSYGLGACFSLGLVLATPAPAAGPPTEPLLDLETGMHTARINRIATDSAGRWAVTASDDKTARVWDVATGRQDAVLRPPQGVDDEGKLFAVALSPDGATVALGGYTGWDWDQKHSIYLFDRASGRLTRRISGLPGKILHLSYSSDGRWLAASLGQKGVRLFDAASGKETGRDVEYGDHSYSAAFSPDGSRLVTTCFDGLVRLYAVERGRLRLIKAVHLAGGNLPHAARFAPAGRMIAVSFEESTVVQVLDAATLDEVGRPSTAGVDNGDLLSIAWSADGSYLLAGGRWQVANEHPVRRWPVGDWARYRDLPLAEQTVRDLTPLPGGGMLFAAVDPSWGVLDRDGEILRRQVGELADLRGRGDELRLSADGRKVRFGYERRGQYAKVFDVATRTLEIDDPLLAAASTQAPGLNIEHWRNETATTLNGRLLALGKQETSRSLAIAADGRNFALGTDSRLRLFDSTGKEVWRHAAPRTVWAVNISADGRFVVAGYADGTIRWHRMKDGRELLAFFPHADKKNWVAWTPEGYFDASAGAERLIGYHLNRGRDKEGEFVDARQLWETFYQPGLIAHRLDADGNALLDDMVSRRGDVRRLLAAAPPELELLSLKETSSDGTYRFRLRIKFLGLGKGRLVIRVDGRELTGRWQAPVFTPGGIVELPLDLADGSRSVTAELVDSRGIGSQPVRASVQVRRTTGVERATLHILAVGITQYRDGGLTLKYAAADAEAIAKRIAERGAPLFQGRVVMRTLLDKDATAENIGATLKAMAAKAQPEDTFVLFMAGHGTTLDEEYFFMPWDLESENEAALRKQAISQTQLREWQSLLPVRSLLLLDTCRSGNIFQLAGRAAQDQDALLRLGRVSQRVAIAASSADRIALEGYEGHGVFSWAVLDALLHADYDKNGRVDVTDIATHVRRYVPAITEEKFKYRQMPMQDTPGEPFAVAIPEQAQR